MKTIKLYEREHKYYTVSARLNYFEMIKFRKLQKRYKLTSSELIRKYLKLKIFKNYR